MKQTIGLRHTVSTANLNSKKSQIFDKRQGTMLTIISTAITKDSTNHSLILPTLCLIFHICLAYSLDPATTRRMILPISENVFCFGKERNSKTIKIINYIFGEIWTIGIMNLILKDKTDSVMPESFVLSQKCAALIVRRFSSISSSHAQTQM